MLRWMAKEATRINLPKAGYHGGLVLDEMNIQKDLQIVSKGAEWRMVGLPEIGEGSSAMTAMTHKKESLMLADHVLQFMFHGLTGFRMPFACFPTNQANASDLFLAFWKAIHLLRDWHFHVQYLSIDGSSNNRAFVKMLFEGDPLQSKMTIINRADRDQKVTIIPDPSHLIKKVRNAAFNSGESESHTRLLKVEGKKIIWKHWENAFEWGQDREVNPVAPHPKIAKEFIYLSDPAKMRNFFAEETLNENMLVLMKSFQASLDEEKASELSSTVKFLEHTSVLVKNFKDRRPISAIQDQRLCENQNVLTWFQQWEKNASKSSEMMSAKCREDLAWMITGFEDLVYRML